MINMPEVNALVHQLGFTHKEVAHKAGINKATACFWGKSKHGAILHNLEAYLNVIGYTIDVEPMGEQECLKS